MMRGEAPLQSIPERGQLGAKAAPSQLRQDLRVGGPADQRVEHRPSGGTEHACGYRRELYPGILKHLLQTLDLPCALLDLRLAVAGEVPKLPDLFGRDEAGAHQPVLHELANPLGVLDVGLPAWDVLEVAGIEKPQLEVVLQHVVDGLPVDPGGFHAHQRHLKGSQPTSEQQQPSRVVVANSRISWCRASFSSWEILTPAVTELLCTSSPAHRSMILSPPLLSVACRAPFSSPGGASSLKSLVFVL